MLYCESGHLPARFYIKRIKLVFYQYILTQKEDSLLCTFLMAQKEEPKRGDWYSEKDNIKEEFNIISSEEEIKRIPPKVFKNIVKNDK